MFESLKSGFSCLFNYDLLSFIFSFEYYKQFYLFPWFCFERCFLHFDSRLFGYCVGWLHWFKWFFIFLNNLKSGLYVGFCMVFPGGKDSLDFFSNCFYELIEWVKWLCEFLINPNFSFKQIKEINSGVELFEWVLKLILKALSGAVLIALIIFTQIMDVMAKLIFTFYIYLSKFVSRFLDYFSKILDGLKIFLKNFFIILRQCFYLFFQVLLLGEIKND